MGEAGLLEQSSAEAKSLKTKGQGLSDYHSNETVVEAARRGQGAE